MPGPPTIHCGRFGEGLRGFVCSPGCNTFSISSLFQANLLHLYKLIVEELEPKARLRWAQVCKGMLLYEADFGSTLEMRALTNPAW